MGRTGGSRVWVEGRGGKVRNEVVVELAGFGTLETATASAIPAD